MVKSPILIYVSKKYYLHYKTILQINDLIHSVLNTHIQRFRHISSFYPKSIEIPPYNEPCNGQIYYFSWFHETSFETVQYHKKVSRKIQDIGKMDRKISEETGHMWKNHFLSVDMLGFTIEVGHQRIVRLNWMKIR